MKVFRYRYRCRFGFDFDFRLDSFFNRKLRFDGHFFHDNY